MCNLYAVLPKTMASKFCGGKNQKYSFSSDFAILWCHTPIGLRITGPHEFERISLHPWTHIQRHRDAAEEECFRSKEAPALIEWAKIKINIFHLISLPREAH